MAKKSTGKKKTDLLVPTTEAEGKKAIDRQKNLSQTGTTKEPEKKGKERKINVRSIVNDQKFQRQIAWYFNQVLETKNTERFARYNELTHMIS